MGSTAHETGGDGSALEQRVAAFRHPHLVALTPSGTWYTMDRRAGVSFADLQANGTKLEARVTLRLLLDALTGLDAVHYIDGEGGPGPYVHGELCPSSILAGRDGIGRLIAVPTRRLVGAALHDARGYLAPEKLLGDRVDQRADVFSVGVLLWEAISGRRLFADASVDAVVTQLVGGRVPPLVCSPDATWASALEPVVQRALAVDPSQRWPNVRALAGRAESLARGHLAPIAQVAAVVSAHRAIEIAAGRAAAANSSVPPYNAPATSSSGASEPSSVRPDTDRARRDLPPTGQIAWEHAGSSVRPPRPVELATTHGARQAKLVGAALAVSFLIAGVSGYFLLFRGAVDDVAPARGSVLVTRQSPIPSAAALDLAPAPTPVLIAVTTPPSSLSPPPGAPAARPAAPAAPGVRPPQPTRPAPAPRPAAPVSSAPRPVKPKLDPKDVFGI